jgi:hypothetical protein
MSDSVISIFRLDGSRPVSERLLDERRQIGIQEMQEGKIHAHGQRTNLRTHGVPHRQLPAGLAEAPLADLRHQAQVVAISRNPSGRVRPYSGCAQRGGARLQQPPHRHHGLHRPPGERPAGRRADAGEPWKKSRTRRNVGHG